MGPIDFLLRWVPSAGRARRTVWFGALAVLAIAMVAAACSSSDGDDDEAQADSDGPGAAQVQSQEDPPSPVDSTSDDAADGPGEDTGNIRELTPVEADPDAANDSDDRRRITVETGSSRGDSDGSAGTTAGALTEALGIDVSSGRFSLTLRSDITASGSDPETAAATELILGLLEDVQLEGAFSAKGDVEISIATGPGAALPGLDLVVVDDEIYTNFGFGWLQGLEGIAGLVGLLGDDLALDLADLDIDSLDLDALDLGSLDLDALGLDTLDLETGLGELLDVLTDVGVEPIDGRQARHLRGSLSDVLSSLGDGANLIESGSLDVDVWLEVDTDIPLRLVLKSEGLTVGDGAGGTAARIGSLDFDTRIDPDIGVPIFLSADIRGISSDGDLAGIGGDIFISFELTDVNTSIEIAAPIP